MFGYIFTFPFLRQEFTKRCGDSDQLMLLLDRINSPFVRNNPPVLEALMKLIPFLACGEQEKMKTLIDHFKPYLSFPQWVISGNCPNALWLESWIDRYTVGFIWLAHVTGQETLMTKKLTKYWCWIMVCHKIVSEPLFFPKINNGISWKTSTPIYDYNRALVGFRFHNLSWIEKQKKVNPSRFFVKLYTIAVVIIPISTVTYFSGLT